MSLFPIPCGTTSNSKSKVEVTEAEREYIRDLIRQDQKRKAQEQLEKLSITRTRLRGSDKYERPRLVRKFVNSRQTQAKKMAEIRKRPQVIRDLIDIATYIAEANLDRSARFLHGAEKTFKQQRTYAANSAKNVRQDNSRLQNVRQIAVKCF